MYGVKRGKRACPTGGDSYLSLSNTEQRKTELFGKVRSGQVRFLLGSTQKMGAGSNVQDRLIALHHLDVPWRPSEEGRTQRYTNKLSKIKAFRNSVKYGHIVNFKFLLLICTHKDII